MSSGHEFAGVIDGGYEEDEDKEEEKVWRTGERSRTLTCAAQRMERAIGSSKVMWVV